MTEENVYAPPAANLAVPAENDLAGRWERLGAALIDVIISLSIIFPVLYAAGGWEMMVEDTLSLFWTLIYAFGGFLLFCVLHSYLLAKYGQTIGKRLAGIRIVDVHSGEKHSLSKLLLARYVPVTIVSNLPVVGQFLAVINVLFIFRQDKRCVHDLIAGTKVVRANSGAHQDG